MCGFNQSRILKLSVYSDNILHSIVFNCAIHDIHVWTWLFIISKKLSNILQTVTLLVAFENSFVVLLHVSHESHICAWLYCKVVRLLWQYGCIQSVVIVQYVSLI